MWLGSEAELGDTDKFALDHSVFRPGLNAVSTQQAPVQTGETPEKERDGYPSYGTRQTGATGTARSPNNSSVSLLQSETESQSNTSSRKVQQISHSVANFFGDSDRARRHKEVAFHEDIRALIEEMVRLKAHVIAPEGHFVPAPPKAGRKKKKTGITAPVTAEPRWAIVDVIVEGAQEWQSKFQEYLRNTTWDPKLGYPLVKEKATPRDTRLLKGTILDRTNENPILYDGHDDLHGDEIAGAGLGAGALGGGDEFSTGLEEA
ncbi:hypothetical protein FB451DRAFT_1181899 [Mycena latifolia]|nr:hypothetical protein FB451DRAFT_1181899 [Mycena latifolia]